MQSLSAVYAVWWVVEVLLESRSRIRKKIQFKVTKNRYYVIYISF